MKNSKGTSLKFAGIFAAIALMVAAVASNVACVFWFHQPKAPENLKNLRKSK